VDEVYKHDEDYLVMLRKEAPWLKNNRFFKITRVSALAAMKMLKHSLAGVKKGRASKGGMPIEVMGLLIGKPEGEAIVILDAAPIPVEGIEYKVEASQEATIHMANLQESMEDRRNERFVGWYHSHPFDVEVRSNCFMSAMDVGTQTAYQFQLPVWVAIVVDPLRSIAKQQPEFGAFRVFPATYTPPAGQAPDGSTTGDKEEIQLRWGPASNRYYSLDITYFTGSSLGHKLLGIMSKNNLWVRVLSSTTMLDPDNRDRFPERVSKAAAKLEQAARSEGGFGREHGGRWGGHHGGGGGSSSRKGKEQSALAQGVLACSELAIEQCKGHSSQLCKDILFNLLSKPGGGGATSSGSSERKDERKA